MKKMISLVALFALFGGHTTAAGRTPNTLDKNRILSIIKSASGNKKINYPEPTEQVGEYYTKKDSEQKTPTTTPPSPFRASPNPKILPPSTTTSPEVERLSNFGIFVNPFIFRESKKEEKKDGEEEAGGVVNDTKAQKDESISKNINILPSIPPSGSMVYGGTRPNKIVIISDKDNSPKSANVPTKAKSQKPAYSPRGIGRYF